MKCMCAQTRPRFILSSKGVFGGMEFEPMLTPREKSPLPENVPRGSNPRRCGQRAQALPTTGMNFLSFKFTLPTPGSQVFIMFHTSLIRTLTTLQACALKKVTIFFFILLFLLRKCSNVTTTHPCIEKGQPTCLYSVRHFL